MTTFECRKHGVRYQQPDGMILDCPVCINESLITLKKEYIEVVSQRDKLLDAINIKLNIKVDSI